MAHILEGQRPLQLLLPKEYDLNMGPKITSYHIWDIVFNHGEMHFQIIGIKSVSYLLLDTVGLCLWDLPVC